MSDERTHQFGGEETGGENEFREGETMLEEFGAENEAGGEEKIGEERISSNGKRIKALSIDRLSELPEPLLIHILSFLGVEQAAITSVLSKRWRFLWVEVPRLEFRVWGIGREKMPLFVAWVHRIVAIRSGNYLEKFNLQIRYDGSLASDVDAWVEFAVKSKVKEVTLRMSSDGDFYTLPEMLYSNSTLTKLSLCGCIMASERTIEWKYLTSLVIENVELPQLLIDKIFIVCPVLSFLNLSECWGFDCLKIDSPSLHKLWVYDSEEEDNGPLLEISAPYVQCLDICLNPEGRELRLTNISSVVKASINLSVDWIGEHASTIVKGNVKEILEKTQHVKELELRHNLFEVLSYMVADGWQIPQSRRVTLSVTAFPDDEHNMTAMIGLLESSPDLETLVVDGFQLSGEDSLSWQPPARDDLSRDLLHLKSVEIMKFGEPSLNGGDPMLMLARILLKRAPVLEKMLLCTDIEDDHDFARIGIILLTYPRSSPKAAVEIPY